MLNQPSQTLLPLPTARVSADPPYVVLQREFARRQTQRTDVPRAAGPTGESAPELHPGVYAIRNRITGRVYVSSDLDVDAGLELDRAALESKQHRNAALQDEWDWYGEDSFTFKVIARIEPRADRNYHGKLAQSVEMFREELGAFGRTGYNSRVSVPF